MDELIPKREWLKTHLKNFATLIKQGKDPSIIIEYDDAEIEIRLNRVDGIYKRETIEVKESV
jgi:hypothetical protein